MEKELVVWMPVLRSCDHFTAFNHHFNCLLAGKNYCMKKSHGRVNFIITGKNLRKTKTVPWPLAVSSSDCRRLSAEELETVLVSLPPKLSKLSGVAGVLSQDP